MIARDNGSRRVPIMVPNDRSPIPTLLIALLLVLPLASGAAKADEEYLAAREAHALSETDSLTLVDVRTPAEWRAEGIPDGAAAVSLNQPGGRQAFLEGILALVDGDRERPLAMICNTGIRSSAARAFLKRNGFTHVYDVAGGLHGSERGTGWMADDLPMESCERC